MINLMKLFTKNVRLFIWTEKCGSYENTIQLRFNILYDKNIE